ncbi:hypothetical protein HG530_012639 [Fusarium avenaceum]|nr:hypothetical protein HG530_012639 [Fusarium avenaceum]KIL88396.1 hypothetical protein FAVG1_08476 [Fusarium avenaceum]
MKFLAFSVFCLPMVSAQVWFTNSGWSKPATFNSKACASNPNVHYFCGTLGSTTNVNPYPDAFPIQRPGCTLADTLGRGCNWRGATGIVVCC